MKAVLGYLSSATLLLGGCATGGQSPPVPQPSATVRSALASVSVDVSEASLRGYIEKMVSFGTRHTLSDQVSNTRGIGTARRWVESEFRKMSADCSTCLEVITVQDTLTAPPRVPSPTVIANAVAIQRGATDPNRVIIIQGHLDSRVTDVMNFTADAPGANDDASGVAAVMEAARILSKRKFGATLVFAALSGEEQGLHGGRILADYAKKQGWEVLAVLNNDIVGNSHGMAAHIDDRVRVFSEGVRSNESETIAAARRSVGGEVDAPSRNLARYVDAIAQAHMPSFDVSMVYRRDRFSRGGDQVPMVEAGFPAVRVTEAAEHYHRQHQDLRTENGVVYGDTIDGVDFPYLARVTKLNAMTMAALASAPRPPREVKIDGAVSANTTVTWTASEGAASYIVWWRDTTSPVWQHSKVVAAGKTSTMLETVVIDDWFFGVQAVSPDGYASPVQFAGVVGAFFPPRQ
ncbi:MAG: M28 family metallopeptidase [Hyphomonadaceae bacterium]